MSNPFDQFAVDVQAALPGAPPAGGGGDPGNPFGTVFADAPPPQPSPAAPKPVMNVAPMAMGGGGGPPPPAGAGMYGQPPPAPQQQQQPPPAMGGMTMNGQYGQPPAPAPSMYGQQQPPPPQPPAPSMYGSGLENLSQAPPPAAPPAPSSDPYGSGAFGMPPAAPPAPAAPTSDPFAAYGAPPPPAGPPAAPPASPNPYGAPPPQQQPGLGAAPVPYGQPPQPSPSPSPYGAPAPVAAAPPASDPYGGGYGMPPQPPAGPPAGAAPPASNPYGGAMVPAGPPPAANDPFGGGYGMPPAAPPQPPAASPNPYGAPPAMLPQSEPQQQLQQAPNPYGDAYGAPPPQQAPPAADPGFGALVPSQQPPQAYPGAPPPQQQPPMPAVDPFSVFNSAPAPAPQPPAPAPAAPPSDALVPATAPAPSGGGGGDLWGDLGFDAPPPAEGVPAVVGGGGNFQEEKKESGDLPPGGEFYDARIFTPTLGVMFFKPQELTDSLFLNTDRSIVDGLNDRPVVAFIVEGSSARSAGVELGHVLLKVNGVDVKNPKEASRLIKEGPRPLPLTFYVPSTDVVVAEGEHMVKYDTRETTAPNSAKDWKPKYVVIGGIIAQPWMMNMYRSKSEYDIAVIETQARRPVSVKVKQFSLQGARVQNDWQGPQMVKYKNKLHPWKYIVVLPVARNPIKISSPNLAQLKPVHEGIRRVLLAQQRSRGGNPHSAGPVGGRDPYSGQNYNRQQQQQQQNPQQQQQQQMVPQNAGYAAPSGYTGGY